MRLVEYVETQFSMGGDVQIGLILPDMFDKGHLFDRLWLEIFRFEKAASRFIQNSELTRLNNNCGLKQPVSDHFRAALHGARYSAQLTDDLFNPFTLPAVQRTGYLASTVAREQVVVADVRKRHITSPDNLEVGNDWARIPYGTAIDLGGCGKGYIIDIVAEIARTEGAVGGWIEASGDIYAWGSDVNGKAISIAVQNPHGTRIVHHIQSPHQGMGIATSGTFARPGLNHQKGEHHIIDPRTEKPALTDINLATVCAPKAIDADVLASCAIILGSDEAPDFLAARGATDWILQRTDRRPAIVHGNHIVTLKPELQHA